MRSWRDVLGFEGHDLNFETVHMRFREMALELEPPVNVERLNEMNWALEQARKELVAANTQLGTPADHQSGIRS